MRALHGVVLALALTACAAPRLQTTVRRAPTSAVSLDEIRDTVATARQLDFKGLEIDLLRVERDELRTLFEAQHHGASDEARSVASAFAWRRSETEDTAPARAFYDVANDRIVATKNEKREVIAHEMHHALLQRNFDVRRMLRLAPDEDAKLALLGLIEGDAAVTMHASVGATSVPGAFPKEDALRFVTALRDHGGFALVNRAYERPPISTTHVLHPDKYIAGILPAVVSPPISMGKRVASGTWGELRTRTTLASCVHPKRARVIADGWQGDAYTLGEQALHWITVWSDTARARAFAEAVSQCETKRTVRASRAGDRVVVTVDATEAFHEHAEASLAKHPVVVPPALPLGVPD